MKYVQRFISAQKPQEPFKELGDSELEKEIYVTSPICFNSKDSDVRSMEERINSGDHDGVGLGFGLLAKK